MSNMLERKQQRRKKRTTSGLEMALPFAPMGMPDNGTIESDSHTLISIDIPAEMAPLQNDAGEIIQGIYQEVPATTLHKLFLSDFDDETKHGVHKIINRLQESNQHDHLEMHISGHGGYISEGLGLFNIVNSMFKERSTAYLTYGYSMNALAFLFANERIVYEHSEIMFHTYSAGFGGKRDDILSQIAHTDKHLQKFFTKVLTPFFNDEEIKQMSSNKDYWLNAHEMLLRGIATGIIMDGEYRTKDEYFEKHDKKGNVRKKWLKAQAKIEEQANQVLQQMGMAEAE